MQSPPAALEVCSTSEGEGGQEKGKKKLVKQDTLDSSSLSQTPSLSSEGTLSPVVRGDQPCAFLINPPPRPMGNLVVALNPIQMNVCQTIVSFHHQLVKWYKNVVDIL